MAMKRRKKLDLRNAILRRDNVQCRWCYSNVHLEVHHLNYENSTLDQLITLCKKCHNRIHLIEKTHVDGDYSSIWCDSCREDGVLVSHFLIKKLSTKKWVWVCPNCGRGVTHDDNYDTLDEWINPFHSEMMVLFPPTSLEIWT